MTYAMLKHKKGISPVIAWILILGISVALGSIVTNWYLSKTETITESTLSTLEGGIECNDVNVNVAYTKISGNCIIKVSNTGQFKIDYVKINTFQKAYGKNPKEYKNFTATDFTAKEIPNPCTLTDLTVIPVIQRDKHQASCPNDRIYKQTP